MAGNQKDISPSKLVNKCVGKTETRRTGGALPRGAITP